MSQAEIDQKLDELENDIEEEDLDEPKKVSAPGFITYEKWVENGKDPADWKGENAYKAEYERIKEIRELKDSMKVLVETTSAWQQQQTEAMNAQIEKAKREAEAELERAKEDEDVAAALNAKEKLLDLEKQKPAQPQAKPNLNPVITDFINQNPILDRSSSDFDGEFFKDMSDIQTTLLEKLTGGNQERIAALTDDQVLRTMSKAFKEAKELHADKFVSPRNQRQSTPSPKQRGTQKGDVKTKLRSITGNKMNPRDSEPAREIYEMLLATDEKAAEAFAKNVLGE